MAELLFEIGCEELPPGSISSITTQIKENIINGLKENDISIKDEVTTYNTPRRIAIYIVDLPKKQEVKEVEIKGPDKEKAFDKSGRPTQAGIGFAKKYNLEPKDLLIKKVNNIEYVFVKTKTGGQEIKDILSKILPESIRKITADKLMKWGNTDEKFVRPIRWILAILDNQIIDFSYSGVKSNNYTYGHRFLSEGKIKVNLPNEYEKTLLENKVYVSYEERKKKINIAIEEEAKKTDNVAVIDNDLLEEVTNITEFPKSMLCNFDESFLLLPEPVIETVLRKHQKYFITIDSKTKKLSNNFIVITNGTELKDEKYKTQIKKGNEKVVRARLNDARFFLEKDLKRPFTYEERIDSLSKITFQKGLGSMKEKVTRIIELSKYIFEMMEKQTKLSCSKEDVITVAKLCKLDLSTYMVFEMPELQGTIGTIYARKSRFSELISKSIEEHYKNTAGDNTASQIVGIADRLDNLICLFAINKIPTGSADPFALRGQTQSLFNFIEIIQDQYKITLKLSELINLFTEQVATGELKTKITNETIKKIKEFLTERLKLKYLVSYSGIPDIVEATFATGDPLNNIYLLKDNLTLLYEHFLEPKEDDKAFLTAAKRLVRIVEPNTNGNVDVNCLKSEEEKILLKTFEELSNKKHKDINEYYNNLKLLTVPINTFFDKVLVNDPDPKIKQTRHVLLKKGKDLFEKICDFNQIIERN